MRLLTAYVLTLIISLSAWAGPKCSNYFVIPTAVEILESINQQYSHKFFNQSIDENIQKSSLVARSYKLFKLNRLLKNLDKNGPSFDHYELSNFIYRLDKLAFAEAVEPGLNSSDKRILSEARRSLLNQGIVLYFGINNPKSSLYKKILSYLSQSISWKYWRWSMAWMGMPKLVGTALPPELAHKIMMEGLAAHRSEVERYLPQIKGRSFFNTFSRVYNTAIIVSLFTVVPYMVHDFYTEQLKIGTEQARILLEPLVKSTLDMSQVDHLMLKEVGALEKYIEAYRLKYGQEPTSEQVEVVKERIKNKLNNN